LKIHCIQKKVTNLYRNRFYQYDFSHNYYFILGCLQFITLYSRRHLDASQDLYLEHSLLSCNAM
jgi:hypothetical protein